MTQDLTLDPRLREDPVEAQPQQPKPQSRRTIDDVVGASDGEDNVGGEKRRKLNLLKCKQCRDARKKCFPVDRVWPEQKCNRCLQHRPNELECSEPQLNTRKRGQNKSKLVNRSKRSASERQVSNEPRNRASDSDTSSDGSSVYDRPTRTRVVKTESVLELPKTPKAHSTGTEELNKRPPFNYLRLKENEFRVLLLTRGRKNDNVVCSLLTASLSEPLEYEAISYLWADDAHEQTLVDVALVDHQGKSHLIPIRSFLHAALRSLRHHKVDRKFWVDALCIDHNNEEEKTQQIRMKQNIFRKAGNLCFWLGEDSVSRTALTFIPQILDLVGIDKLVKDDEAIDGWVAFVALLKKNVFSRLWLLQEVAVAQNVTLHCGLPAIHYGDLADAVATFLSFRDEISLLFRRNQKNRHQLMDRKMAKAECFVEVSTHALRVTNSGKSIQRLLSLETLVSKLSDLSSTDPRDRIFAVLAIAKDGPQLVRETSMEFSQRSGGAEPLELNYEKYKSITTLYEDFVIHAIERSKSLDIICRLWARLPKGFQVDLPTWVRPLQSSSEKPFDPNASERTEGDSFVGLPDHKNYNASKGTSALRPQYLESYSQTRSLFAYGYRIDTISKLGREALEGNILYEWLELGGSASVDETSVPEDLSEEFWRTLVADRGPNGSNAPSWYRSALIYCRHIANKSNLTSTRDIITKTLIENCETESSLVVKFLQRVQSVIWNRKFLISRDKSWMGLAPMAADVDDVIAIFYGCSVPVVLRPISIGEWRGCYYLVGECYVHGIMDGEEFDAKVAGNVVTQEFVLR